MDDRVTCAAFGRCGGCRYGAEPYAEQLAAKEQELMKLFRTVLPEEFFACGAYEGMLGSPSQWGSRNKMEFSFGNESKDGPLTLGLHRKGSFYDIIPVPDCRIAPADFGRICAAVQAYFREKGVPFLHKRSHQGSLRHLVLRSSQDGSILVNLVTASNYAPEEDFVSMLSALPLEGRISGILHTENDSLADAVIPDKVNLLWGEDFLTETVLGMRFRISPFSFFQTNTRGAEVLYGKAREYISLTPGCTVYDLYSGTGTIAQILSPAASHVYGVEIVEDAVAAARENAALNGIGNCTFLAGDVLEKLGEIEERPDYVILDPPREGVNPKALRQIMQYDIPAMVYISCKATSFVNDMLTLRAAGWRIRRAALVDLFPETCHVETVCLLSKLSEAKNHISVKVDMDEMDVTAAESKATYEEIQEWVQEKYGFHVSHLNIAKTKRKCGIIERQNYNLPKSEDSRSPETPPEKEKAIKEAFSYFQMI